LVDLSPGGAGILLDRELPEGTPVRLSVSLPALRRGKEGRVAHSQRLEDTPSLWRVGIAFPPVPPSTIELLGARVVCWGSLIIVVSSFAGQEHGFGTYISLVALVVILLGLAIGAELTYRASLRRYREQRLHWESPFPAIATSVESEVRSQT
jgi:hypothetical protein